MNRPQRKPGLRTGSVCHDPFGWLWRWDGVAFHLLRQGDVCVMEDCTTYARWVAGGWRELPIAPRAIVAVRHDGMDGELCVVMRVTEKLWLGARIGHVVCRPWLAGTGVVEVPIATVTPVAAPDEFIGCEGTA